MPILLDDLQKNTQNLAKVYSPTFFHQRMTGSGKSTGLLSQKNDPLAINPNEITVTNHIECNKRTYKQDLTELIAIPLNPIHATGWRYMETLTVDAAEKSNWLKIGTDNTGNNLYLRMVLNSVCIEEVTDPNGKGIGIASVTKTPHFNYMLMFFAEADPNDMTFTKHDIAFMNVKPKQNQPNNKFSIEFSSNPLLDLTTNYLNKLRNYYTIDDKTILNWIGNYSVYDAAVEQATTWQETIHKGLDQFFRNMTKWLNGNKMLAEPEIHLIHQLRYLTSYNIPLELYKHIYASVKTAFPKDLAEKYFKENLNLMLSSTMDNLNQQKSNFPPLPVPNPEPALPESVKRLSPQQLNAAKSTDPLILVQSGAGSGKSTLILARIDYMIACGIDPKDIMILSFTNAAANHITEINPNLHSMTIAKMVDTLYATNYPDQTLSSLDTIINSIDIYYSNLPIMVNGKEPVEKQFKNKLYKLKKNEPNAFTEANNFIEKNLDDVIRILDTIKQTSLELEIILCYLQIDSLIEPNEIKSKYLIMDEVQDNSIFEFVYIIKYITKNVEPLFLVGDASQTLYEFRASNPRAINILEGSGTFTTYKLTTNYRSNQEILDFANILLQNIEANQYANIQLQANSLAAVTEQSFLEKVTFNYHPCKSGKEFKEALPTIITNEVRPYIENCLNRNEKIAFLAYTRKEIEIIGETLRGIFPDKSIVSLVPERTFNSTIMSMYIKHYWDTLKFAPTQSMIQIIRDDILDKLQYLTFKTATAEVAVREMLNRWVQEQQNVIAMWTAQVNNGQITSDVYMDLLKENMLQYEINNNAIKQAVLSQKNQLQKDATRVKNADILLSTIHSAKGLEFDNVVVIHKDNNKMDEEAKRMYYVAFTRAMKSEYILSYNNVMSPKIEADYLSILKILHAKAPAPNSPLTASIRNDIKM